MISCQDISKLLMSDQLETQTWPVRMEIRLHLLMCKFCSRLARQLAQMRSGAQQMSHHDDADPGLEDRLIQRLSGTSCMDGIISRRSVTRAGAGMAVGAVLAAKLAAGSKPVVMEAGGAVLEIQFGPGSFNLPQSDILDWVRRCVQAVSTYLGNFPVPRARLHILLSDDAHGVGNGRSWGEREARCEVFIGRGATLEDLNRDWVLTHELFHFAFPSVPEPNRWIEEGLSTYAEPIARAGAGIVKPERVWNEMIRDMPKGLPAPGDRGLDLTHTWGRTYWGGALFWLSADVGIRKATENRFGVRDALKAINAAGGNITAEWELARTLETGDRATGATVLSDLYRQMGPSPFPVDLPELWKQLGVHRMGDRITFDDHAPLAAIRAGILGI